MSIANVEEIEFSGGNIDPITVVISASQVGAGLPANLLVDGRTGALADIFRVEMGAATSVDLSGFQFEDFDPANTSQNDRFIIQGDGDGETIIGTSIRDEINGAGGDDKLNGGAGADTLAGGEGTDTLSYAGSTEGVVVNLGQGTASGGDAAGDVISGFENLTGSEKDDKLIGGDGANVIVGGAGRDLLDGAVGADTMVGGAGDDFYYVDNAFDVVDESTAGSDGRDFVYSSVRVDLSDTVRFKGTIEWVGLLGSDGCSITGTGNAETLVGNSGGNRIEGAGGNDTITGGDGQDLLYGGENDDTFIVAAQSQLVADENYIGGSGTDAIFFSNAGAYDYDLSTVTLNSIERLQFGSSGGSVELQPATVRLDATQFGDGFSLTGTVQGLAASGRAETLAVTMGSQAALDLSKVVLVDFADPLDRVTITGDSDAETITGTAVADAIQGGDGADTIAGGLGNDTLDGGAGADTLVLSGARSGYTVTRQSATTWTVTGQDGTDTVSGFETVKFGDATVSFRAAANVAPVLAAAIGDQSVAEDNAWSFQVPGGALTDADMDALTFSATLSDGSALPAWLSFDAATRSFAGQPTKDFNGAIGLKVSASDGLTSASGTFTLTVTAVNDAPAPAGAPGGQGLQAGSEDTAYTVTAATLLAGFADVDGDGLTVTGLSASRGTVTANGDGTFTITPAKNFNGTMQLSYAVSDGATDTPVLQNLAIAAVNDAPVIRLPQGGTKTDYRIAETNKAVFTFDASDVEGGKLAWSLSGTDAKLFAINSKTGSLAFKAAPDFEAPKDAGRNNVYDVTLKVSDGEASDTQAIKVKVTDLMPFLTGTFRADKISGTAEGEVLSGLSGNDTLKGFGGNDRLYCGGGADKLYGGDGRKGMGADSFVFTALSESTTSLKGRDTIFDFGADDRIDLSSMDVNGKAAGRPEITFIGAANFSGKVGELRFETGKGGTDITLDKDGNRTADFAIHLDDVVKLAKADFLL